MLGNKIKNLIGNEARLVARLINSFIYLYIQLHRQALQNYLAAQKSEL